MPFAYDQIVLNYSENDVPHPQLEVAFGLLIMNLAPIISSLKSIIAFVKNGRETLSINTFSPDFSNIRSSSLGCPSSIKY